MEKEEQRKKWRDAKRAYRVSKGHFPVNKINSLGELKCGLCKLYKPKEDYYKDNQSIHGITSYCRECAKKRSRDRYRNGK